MKKTKDSFSTEEKAAMRERAQELKAEARRTADRAAREEALKAKIAEMPESERQMAVYLHELITRYAPSLTPRTWYGMPAYENAQGRVVCFFQSAQKFGTRYATLGFTDAAHLDEGSIWPTAFALKEWTPEAEQWILSLIQKAVR